MHDDNSFLTLTYENLPLCESLCKRHLQLFIKRLRKDYDKPIRYYAAGEYGDPERGVREWNPHYHIALFGYPSCVYGRPLTQTKQCNCSNCKFIADRWNRGRTYLGTLEPDSAQYVASYVTKKLTNKFHPALMGRTPEFSVMSNRPGIGASAIDKIAGIIDRNQFLVDDMENVGDVLPFLYSGSKKLPLDRYCRNRLRKNFGYAEETPSQILDLVKQENCIEREKLLAESSSYKKYGDKLLKSGAATKMEKTFNRKQLNRKKLI